MRKTSLLSAILVLVVATFGQSGGGAQSAGAGQTAQTYEQSAKGLGAQFGAVVAAYRAGDKPSGERLIEQFRLPHEDQWLSAHLPPEQSAVLQARYDQLFSNFEEALENTMTDVLSNPPATISVELGKGKGEKASAASGQPNQKPSGLMTVKQTPLFIGRFQIQVDGKELTSWPKVFTYEDGAFRYVGAGSWPFWAWGDNSGMGDPKGGHFLRLPVVINQTPPTYIGPTKIRRPPGPVILRATIGKDGSVENLRLLDGDPTLAQVAMDAVYKWRYTPATLGGEPMEVLMDVRVTFNLPQ